MNEIKKKILVAFVLFGLLTLSSRGYTQAINPNNLPLCPAGLQVNWNNCYGTYIHQGNQYSGEWRYGIMDGYGIFTYSTGVKYFGDIKNGKYDGSGEYQTKDGVHYKGEFRDGKFHGKGRHSDGKGNVYEGDWLNGVIEGYGKYIFSDKSEYDGEWKDGKSNGFGSHTGISGARYVGQFKNGTYHGGGTIISVDGNRIDGIFENGILIQETKNSAQNKKIEAQILDFFVIKPVFDWVAPFKDGLASVRVGDVNEGKYGFIDKNGNLVVDTKFDRTYDFHESLAAVRAGDEKTGKWGFIDKRGNLIIKHLYTDITNFSEGLAAVKVGDDENGKWGFIDKKGKIVIDAKFDYAMGFEDDLAQVRIGAWDSGKWGFIDKQGRFVIKPQYDEVHGFHEGFSFVRLGNWESGKWGLINKQGKIVINFQFDGIFLGFLEGLAAVRLGSWDSGKWGFIDKKGNFVIKPQFDSTLGFHDGLATVRVGNDKDGKWGFIDKKGDFLINPIFIHAGVFREGFASVRFKNNKTAYIDKKGNYLINAFFENESVVSKKSEITKFIRDGISEFFSDGLAGGCVKQNLVRKCGFISKDLSLLPKLATLPPENNVQKESGQKISRLPLQASVTSPDNNGAVIITIRTNADTSSLKVNGEEQGGRSDGNYVIKKVARVGQDTNYVITAIDTNGNTDTTTITVARQAVSSSPNQSVSLKPENIKRAASRDAVAIIIGIQNYKRVPKAEFANSDAKDFYEYAIRGLGIKPENIKLLVDEEADDVNIVKAFENWLPLQVNKGKTDVYVFYSGHGLPSNDGKSLYFLPYGVDKELLTRTAVGLAEVVSALVASKPKSVTMFIDACYSGQTRGGETLLASAKPIALKAETNAFPSNFTVITASSNDQISSSSPELKHGIFSFYLMKGMEGDADGNKDGKITAGEMQEYLSDKVSRQAMSMSRKQDTQLVGDANRVLMGR